MFVLYYCRIYILSYLFVLFALILVVLLYLNQCNIFYPCSRSPFIKVPVSWEALVKLVDWLYSDKLPTLVTGCLWDNMDERKKLQELQPYLELCWLADYWLLDNIQEHCSRVINSCLDSSGNLSLEVLQIAARLSLWKLAETAVNRLGPSYSRFRLTGEIEKLDKDLADMVRVASVRHSQDSTKCKLEE